MNRILKISSFILLLIIGNQVFSSDTIQNNFIPKIEWSGFSGKLMYHHAEMKPIGAGTYFGQEIRLGFQTTGAKYWQQAYKYPIYGFGFYSGYFNNKIVGNPMAFFSFLEMPFWRSKKQYLSTSWGIGLTFNINEYDSVLNPQNIAIGTDANVYIDFCLMYKHQINNKLGLGAGVKFQHFSNGAVRYPNLGINMLTGQLTINYLLTNKPVCFYKHQKPVANNKYEFTIMYAGGIKAKSQDENNVRYYNSTLSAVVSKQTSIKRSFGLGIDAFKNDFITDFVDDTVQLSEFDKTSYAIIGSTDMIVNKFRMAVQLGFYVYRAVDYSIPFYERVAMRYYFLPNMFANVSIKAHAFKAQNIEWGIGFTL